MIDIPVKHFYMLRHGESEANAAGVYSGQVDTPLTALGRQQAADTIAVIDTLPVPPKAVVHSHLSRARDTAQIACRNLDVPFYEDALWAEHHLGTWQMCPHEEVRAMRLAGINPPGGETNVDFARRIAEMAKKTLAAHAVPLIVCHGGCFRALSENYGLMVRGTRNSMLYEFTPASDNKKFPWDVYVYGSKGRMLSNEYDG